MFKKIADGMELGESPFWDSQEKKYYWVDILKKRLYWYKNENIFFKEYDEYPSFIFKNNKNNICIAFESGIYTLDDKYNKDKKYVSFKKDGFRCNDGSISPNGKLFIGRMNNLYNYGEKKFEFDGKVLSVFKNQSIEVLKNVAIPNGMVWNENSNKVFFIDSFTRKIQKFDYVNNTFINSRTIFEFEDGSPDGMAIDSNKNLWIAIYGTGKLICLNPETSKIIKEYYFEEKNITSCCFAGEKLNQILVTTAKTNEKNGSVYILEENIIGKDKNIYYE